ncbi:MAG: hypothetical protein WC389_22745, partial [Lutibacter sp.]
MKNLILNKNVKFSTTAVVVLTGVCVLISVFAIINVVNAGNFEVSVMETGGRMACESMPPFSNIGSNYFTYTVSVVNNSSEGYRIAIAAFHSDKAGCGAFDGAAGSGWSIVSGKQNYLPGESGTLVLRYKVDTYNCGRTQYDAGYRPFGADMSESTVFIADVVNYGEDCNYNPPVNPQPTCSITANPTSIIQGNYSTLNWSSNNATSCTASDGWGGSKSLSGTQSVAPVGDATYTLTCSGAGGSVTCSTAIDVTPVVIPDPTCSITANPSSITEGNYSTLSWTSNNATSCYASNAWYGTKSLSGSQSVSPTNDSTYTLVCSNGYNSTTCSATIDVSTVHNAPNLRIEKLVRNVTNSNPNFYETVSADLGDELEFLIRVYSIGTGTAYNVRVKDLLPTGLTYVSGTTTID